MRNSYIKALYDLSENNKEILSLVADNGAIVFDKYRERFPERFINFGISEANMVSAAAGLASCGKIPFAYTIAGFITMRAYEQIRNDVCLQNQNVKLVGVGAGMRYSALGSTHHALEDIAIMRVLPNMSIIVPATPREAYEATVFSASLKGPVYIRLEATREKELYDDDYVFEFGKAVNILEGDDVTLISMGSIIKDVLEAADDLRRKGINARVINMHTIKPIDEKTILKAAKDTGKIVTVEEHSVIGGLGSAVEEILLANGIENIKFKKIGVKNVFCTGYGSHEYLKKKNNLGIAEITDEVLKLVNCK